MNDSFDLDQALTMVYPCSSITVRGVTVNMKDPEQLSQEEARDKVSGMPTVGPSLGICTVCMESLYSTCKQAPCGHSYHAACITQWLSYCNSCPICRSEVPGPQKKVPANPPVKEFQ